MPMKVKSDMIRTDKYTYTLPAEVQQIWFAKGNPQGVLELVWLSVYNTMGDALTHLYFLMRYKGQVIRLFHDNAFATVDVDYRLYPVYLYEGCELGIEIDSHAAGDIIEVGCQWLFHKDAEYNEQT